MSRATFGGFAMNGLNGQGIADYRPTHPDSNSRPAGFPTRKTTVRRRQLKPPPWGRRDRVRPPAATSFSSLRSFTRSHETLCDVRFLHFGIWLVKRYWPELTSARKTPFSTAGREMPG